ncbi:MAG TPA: hypothetical protein VMV49_16450 [Candidatus Deferrimicrobium sp.]|nr:hypothetical protein [Candidatus Deferrimicrobium sp.]
MTENSPWTSFDININLILLFIFLGFATFILAIKSWIFLVVFWVFILLYIVVGRYVTCRHCDYLGKPCPSWCMGIIGAKLYKRSEKENFCKEGFLIPFLCDILVLIIAVAIPIMTYLIELWTVGLRLVDWIILIIYIVIIGVTLVMHSITGCKKCTIKDCPLSGNRK